MVTKRLKEKLHNLSILIVEDEEIIRTELVNYLSRICKSVFSAKNGKEGVEVYKRDKPNIVITDIMMPVMDGLKMSKVIREDSDLTQIIVLTAFTETKLLVEAIEAGVNHYLFKPLDMILFMSVLNSSVDEILSKMATREQTTELLTVIKQAPNMLIVTDIDGKITYVNPKFSEITGYSLKEVDGKNPKILQSGEHTKEFYEELWNTLRSGQIWRGEFINRKKNGELYYDKSTIAPIFDLNGNIIKFVAVKEDITESKRIEKELKEKDNFIINQSRLAAMGEMISMIAHQWRQPISTIAMSANNMFVDVELNEIDTEVFKENIEAINEQVDYLSKTIDDFRNFFKPDKEKENVTLNELIDDSIVIMGKSLQNNNITLNISIESNKKIRVFKRELVQVFLNLIKNSKDILLEREVVNPQINIFAKEEKGSLLIKICDNGGGIEEKIQHKIFEPYFTTKNEANGTGLGLYMSKTIIEKHLNGTIYFQNMDGGVCFFISFPID